MLLKVVWNFEQFHFQRIAKLKSLENLHFQTHTSNVFPFRRVLQSLIGAESFIYSSIYTIYIPKHVKKICKKAFISCSSLKEVKFAKDSELEIICEESFSKTGIICIFIILIFRYY